MAVGKRSSKRPLQEVLGQGANVNAGNPLEVHDPKVGSLISYEGTTTADGAGDGSTLIDNVLTTKPDYDGHWVVITSGPYFGQCSDITGATTGGTGTVHEAFDGQIVSGTKFVILAMKALPAEVAALTALVVALMADVGDPTGETLGSLAAKWGDIARSLDLILGARWDAGSDLGTDIAAIIASLATIAGYLDTEIAAILAAVDTEVAAIKAVTDLLPDGGALTALLASIASILEDTGTTLPTTLATIAGYIDTEVAAIITSQGRQLDRMVKWSAGKVQVEIDAAGATVALPTITIENLPDGAVVEEAHLMFKFRMIENKYAGVNNLNGATVALTSQVFQIQDDGGGAWADGINLVDNFFTLASEVREGGDVIIGEPNVGVANVVDGNDIYNVRLLLGKADFDFINFDDCQVGLDILYSI